MKKFAAILLLIHFSVIQSFGQNTCNCKGLIDWKFRGKVLVFDKPDGKIISSISNDSINEDYITLTISDVQNDFYKVTLSLSVSETSKSGWISKNNYIGTYARNYSDDISLKLYSQPDKKSEIESVVNMWIPELYTIVDCKGDWVKVKLIYKGKLYTGWLEKEMQCANPYTTCN